MKPVNFAEITIAELQIGRVGSPHACMHALYQTVSWSPTSGPEPLDTLKLPVDSIDGPKRIPEVFY